MSAPTNTHSVIVTSEDDFKLNIPLSFEEAPNTSSTIRSDGNKSHDNVAFENMDAENANPNNFNCQLWSNTGGFMDDNLSNLNATEYDATTVVTALVDEVEEKSCVLDKTDTMITPTSFQTELNNSNLFELNSSIPDMDNAATIATETLPPSNRIPNPHMYTDSVIVEEDIKYSPNEMMLQSPSTLQYNYNSVLPPPSSQPSQMNATPPYGHPLPPMHHVMDPPNFPRPHLPPQQTHAQPLYGQFSHPSGYHPNMWYPNAPYGSATGYYRPYGGSRYPNCGNYPSDPMLDMLQLSNSGREARNRAEKNRRDKLNGSIQELSTMVPHVAESPRRVDKTAVLRFAAHGLRLQYIFGRSNNNSHPKYTDSLMKMLDRFFIALTCHGQIVLISSSVEHHLGHCQTDLYGQNILNITHPEDHNIMKQQLIPTDLDKLLGLTIDDDDSSEARTRTPEQEEYIDSRLRSDRRSFTVRLARAGPRSEPTTYEIVRIEGNFRRSDAAPRGTKVNTHPSNIHMIRRSRGRDDTIPLHAISGNDIVLIATARIVRPPKFVNSISNSLEYRTRHLIDGRILECDQKIGLVAGYMAGEVRGMSPFTFMHDDDMPYVIVALRQMYDDGRTTGESTYRLSTNTGQYIYLRSKGFLDVDETNNVVHSFLCVNTLLDEEEGKRKLAQMRKDYGPRVLKEFPHLALKSPDAHDPQQLENAVFRLVENLQKPSGEYDEDDGESSTDSYSGEYVTPSEEEIRRCSAHFLKNSYSTVHSAGYRFGKSSKTPPLALVPPEACSIRTSITRSMNIVNTTSVKNLSNEQINSPNAVNHTPDGNQHDSNVDIDGSTTKSEICLCQDKSTDYCNYCQKQNSQLAKSSLSLSNNKRSGESMGSQEMKLPQKRLKSIEIEHVLSDSLNQLGRTLDEQLNAAIELRDKSTKYEVPNSNQRLDELMEEHQMQSQIYVDIKSEYEVQKQNNSIDTSTTKYTMLSATNNLLDTHGNNQRQQQQFSDDENKK